MRCKKKWIIVFVCLAVVIGIGKLVYDLNVHREVTIGSVEQNNSNEISMSYQMFDGGKEYDLLLEEGDLLQIEVVSESGALDMKIFCPDSEDNYVYQGNDIPTSSFSVQIKETGKYHMIVNGHKHKGSYSVVKED